MNPEKDLALNAVVTNNADNFMTSIFNTLEIDPNKKYEFILTGIRKQLYSSIGIDGNDYHILFHQSMKPFILSLLDKYEIKGTCSMMYDNTKRILIILQPQNKNTDLLSLAEQINQGINGIFNQHFHCTNIFNTTYLSAPLSGIQESYANWEIISSGYNSCFYVEDIGFVDNRKLTSLKNNLNYTDAFTFTMMFSEHIQSADKNYRALFNDITEKLRYSFDDSLVLSSTIWLEYFLQTEFRIYNIENQFIPIESSKLFSKYTSFSKWCELYMQQLEVLMDNIEATRNYSTVTSSTIRYILDNLHRDFSITDISEYIGINANYLERIFSSEYGASINQFHLKSRMDKAKELLANTSESIYKVASSIGYNDRRYFSRVFKNETGLTPKEYRKLYKRKKEL